MEEVTKKRIEQRKRSEKIFREADRSREHFLEATKEVTEAEKHLEEVEKERAQIERSMRETEKRVKNTQEAIASARERLKERGPPVSEKAQGRTGKTASLKGGRPPDK